MGFGGRGGGGFRGRGSGRGRGGREGGRPLADQGPPQEVIELGRFTHSCENDIVCQTTCGKIPYFNAPVYFENKEQIGKIDEIFGGPKDNGFSVKLNEGLKSSSFKKEQKLFIDPAKLLPLERFLGAQSGAGRGRGQQRGRGGAGRGGRGGGGGRGRGAFNSAGSGGRGGGEFRGGGRGGGGFRGAAGGRGFNFRGNQRGGGGGFKRQFEGTPTAGGGFSKRKKFNE